MPDQHEKFRMGFVIFNDLTQLDLTGPYEVLTKLPGGEAHLVAKTKALVRSNTGLSIAPTTTFDEAPQFDLIMVPGGSGVSEAMEDDEVLGFLSKQAESARFVTSVCTGSLVLGAAGLLRGYRATTHWLSMDFLELFGAVPTPERVVIDRNRITGGGVTAGIDFGLTVVAEVAGEQTAKRVQLRLEYDPSPPFKGGSPKSADPALVEEVRASTAEQQATRRDVAQRAAQKLASHTTHQGELEVRPYGGNHGTG